MEGDRDLVAEDPERNNNVMLIREKLTHLMTVMQTLEFQEKEMVMVEVNDIYALVSKLSMRDSSGSSQWNLKRPRPKQDIQTQAGFLSGKRAERTEGRGEMLLGNSRLAGEDKKPLGEIKNRARGVTPVLGPLRSSLDKLETVQVKIYINNKAFKLLTLTINTTKKELIQSARRAFFHMTSFQSSKLVSTRDTNFSPVSPTKYTISIWEEKKHIKIKEGTLFKLYVKEIMVDPTEAKKLHFHRKRGKEKETPKIPGEAEWKKVTFTAKQKFKLPQFQSFGVNSKRRSKIVDAQRENNHDCILTLKSGKEAGNDNVPTRTSKSRILTAGKVERSETDKRGLTSSSSIKRQVKKQSRESSKVVTRKASVGSSFFQVKPRLDHKDKIPESEVPETFSDLSSSETRGGTGRTKTLGNTD
eukprot:TRINITY_DN354_c0_g1_i2.p1 TRINITY_DN354_c0_g1~~TRINITY_DN354_c0_g1_i2.p1  ORF type:complete len:415 (-),score=94.36 TRINITY_DN354_c0_g1_i2:151-1395(-)